MPRRPTPAPVAWCSSTSIGAERAHGDGRRGVERNQSLTADVAGGAAWPGSYSITLYRSTPDPARIAAYASLATPALIAAGGRCPARGVAARAYEAGVRERCVIVEWDSVEQVVAFYESPAYQAALGELHGIERDVRIVEGGAGPGARVADFSWMRGSSPRMTNFLRPSMYNRHCRA